MIGRPDRGAGNRTDRRTYSTRSPAKRPLAVDADDLEDAVVEMVLLAFDDATLPAVSSDSAAGEKVAQVEAELAELAELRGAGTISMAEWMAARKPLQERLDAAKVDARQTSRPSTVQRLLGTPGTLRTEWPTLDFQARRTVLETVVETVVVGPSTRGRWTPITDRLDPAQGFGIRWKV